MKKWERYYEDIKTGQLKTFLSLIHPADYLVDYFIGNADLIRSGYYEVELYEKRQDVVYYIRYIKRLIQEMKYKQLEEFAVYKKALDTLNALCYLLDEIKKDCEKHNTIIDF